MDISSANMRCEPTRSGSTRDSQKLTCQWVANCSRSSEMTGASPGKRNISRYIRSASSSLVDSNENDLDERNDS